MVLFGILYLMPLFSQGIYLDEMKNDSIRILESDCICYRRFTDRLIWNWGIKATSNIESGETHYILCLNINSFSSLNYKHNGRLLIKTFTGDVLELKISEKYSNYITLGHSYSHPFYGDIGTIHTNNLYRNIAEFYISEDDLKKFSNNIQRVRIELEDCGNSYNSDYLEYNYRKKDRVGLDLYESYLIIQERLKTPLLNRSNIIYEDF